MFRRCSEVLTFKTTWEWVINDRILWNQFLFFFLSWNSKGDVRQNAQADNFNIMKADVECPYELQKKKHRKTMKVIICLHWVTLILFCSFWTSIPTSHMGFYWKMGGVTTWGWINNTKCTFWVELSFKNGLFLFMSSTYCKISHLFATRMLC